ncbi:MAG: hypothetical protein RLZZ387_3376 [Chloroflexota bacterium]|jgi:diguanylate cyclase (GGDEF)-like protein/PAS domain S-box-containing protein
MSAEQISISLFEHLRAHLGHRIQLLSCTKATLVHLSHSIEDVVLHEHLPALIFTGFQESSHWREETERYRALAAVAHQVCIFAGGALPEESDAKHLHVRLAGDDPLRQEWFLCVFSDRFSVVLCGQDQRVPAAEEATRQFATLLTFDPPMVEAVLDLVEQVVARYRPDRATSLRQARARFPVSAPDPALVTQFVHEMIRFEEQLNAALRAGEARMRAVMELTSDFVYEAAVLPDRRLEPIWVTDACTRITGYTLADFREHGVRSLVEADDWQVLRQHLDRLLAGITDTCELRVITRDGETRWLRVYARPEWAPGASRVGRILGAVQDVTARRRAEEALQQANADLTRWVGILEARNREMSLLNELGEWLQTCQASDEASTIVAQFAQRLFPGASGGLYLRAPLEALLERASSWGDSPPLARAFGLDECWGMRRGRVHVGHGHPRGLRCVHTQEDGDGEMICAPLVAQGELLGLLHLHWATDLEHESQSSLAQRQGLSVVVAEHIALALSNLQLRERLRQQAIRDSLTGLFNRRYMEDALGREVRRATRSGRPIGVIMFDLDHFKSFNDTHGHAAGDLLLREVGALLGRRVRAEDIACRFGGEEFVILMPDTAPEYARRRAEELCGAICELRLVVDGEQIDGVSASIGVATFPEDGSGCDELLRAADTNLYRAKAAARNQISGG